MNIGEDVFSIWIKPDGLGSHIAFRSRSALRPQLDRLRLCAREAEVRTNEQKYEPPPGNGQVSPPNPATRISWI